MRSFRPLSLALLVVYGVFVLAPIFAFIFTAAGEASTENLAELWRTLRATALMRNSLCLSAATTAMTCVVGVPLGFLFMRTDLHFARTLMALSAVPLFLPPFLWATAWLFGIGSIRGILGAWLVMSLSLYPIVMLLSGIGFAHIDPAMEEDCRMFANEWQILRHIMLPLARPLVGTAALLVFILAISEFGTPSLMQVNVFPVAVVTAFASLNDFGQAALMCVPLLAITAILAVILALRYSQLDTLSGAWRPRQVHLSRTHPYILALTLVFLIAVLPTPVATLAHAAQLPHLLLVAMHNSLDSLITGMLLAAAGVVAIIAVAFPFAWVCQRRYAPGGSFWLAIQPVMFTVPGAVIGLGLVCLWNRPTTAWLYDSRAMIVLAYVARFTPLLVAGFAAFFAQLAHDCEEAIWVDGGGALTSLFHFVVPASGRAITLLGLLSFVLCIGELATTILVSPPGVQTLAVRLFTIEANAPRAATANIALLMMAVCAAPLIAIGAGRLGSAPKRRLIEAPTSPRDNS